MTDDATKMKQERDLALAECERLRTRHWTILDDMNKSELDAYDLGCAESIAAVDKILDGKDDGSGTNNEPWYTQRKRLLSLTAECERLRADAERHRDGRLAALEKAATLESSLIEIGDLAASCRTGPALYESLQHIEQMAIFAIDEARAKP